jgi:hypothetical protein
MIYLFILARENFGDYGSMVAITKKFIKKDFLDLDPSLA